MRRSNYMRWLGLAHLGVEAHIPSRNGLLLPPRERRIERYGRNTCVRRLQHADTKRAYSILGLDTCAVLGVDRDVLVGVRHIRDDGA